ncbi:WhiB family transcriptional regulator [Streptomyces salinarius]|uniref:WhiB family transcriptional regulator n=1 Tax=Streptomyces salinarius TaxID=2762598 RepID=UPI003D7F8F0A
MTGTRPHYPCSLRPVESLWDWQFSAVCRGMVSLVLCTSAHARPRPGTRGAGVPGVPLNAPVRERCNRMAVAAGEHDGVWGGLQEADQPVGKR